MAMSKYISITKKAFPVIANCVVYGSLYVGAEYSQQLLTKRIFVEKSKQTDIDYVTLGHYAVMGTCVYSPSLYLWYKWLDSKYPGTEKASVIKKLLLDQFLLTPILLVVFFTGMSLMENADDTFKEVREKFLPTFLRACFFWPPIQTINFVVIPPKFRVTYMGICGFLWVNVLCWVKRQHAEVHPAPTSLAAQNNLAKNTGN